MVFLFKWQLGRKVPIHEEETIGVQYQGFLGGVE